MTTKQFIYPFAFVAALSITGAGGFYVASRHSSTPSYSCVAGPDELCASDQFFFDYSEWKDLKAEIPKITSVKELKHKSDELNGMTQRLSQQIPQGYSWDEKKSRFVKASQPTLPPPPAVKK